MRPATNPDEAPIGVPCLNRDNSDKNAEVLSAQLQKQAYAVKLNAVHFVKTYGIESCAFLTITFDPSLGILPCKEAQRRLNNYHRRVLAPLFPVWLKVMEFQKNGNPHYHLLVVCSGDVRSGFNFEFYDAISHWTRQKTKTPKPVGNLNRNPLLVSLHNRLKETREAYGIGRIELIPIRKNASAVGSYMSERSSKGAPVRTDENKGARFVSYSRAFDRVCKGTTAWVENKGREWRLKVGAFAAKHGCRDFNELAALFGPHWAYNYRQAIFDTPVPEAASKSGAAALDRLPAVAKPADQPKRVYAIKKPAFSG